MDGTPLTLAVRVADFQVIILMADAECNWKQLLEDGVKVVDNDLFQHLETIWMVVDGSGSFKGFRCTKCNAAAFYPGLNGILTHMTHHKPSKDEEGA